MHRIALVTPMFPVPHDPTRGRYIYETARSLAKRAHVRVFFQQQRYPSLPGLRPRNFLHERVDAGYRMADIDVEAFEYPAVPVVSRPLNGLVSARGLVPRLRRFQPDVVLAYWLYPDGYAAARAARILKVPVVVGALGSDVHVPGRLNSAFIRRLVATADALLTVSEDMRRALVRQFGADPHKVHAVVNGYNAEVFKPRDRAVARRKLGVAGEDRLILYVGRFVRAKGLVELVNVFARLASRNQALRLVLVGDGVMREELIRLLDASGARAHTLLPGGLEPDGVAQWMAAADLLCLPSWSEGYPNVVVEAAACGIPVVATDVGGTSEIINATNGVLVPPRDERQLEQAIGQVIDRPWDPRVIAASVHRSWDDVARETLAVCEQVILPREGAAV